MTRYHPLLVVLHWLMALLIVLALVFGTFVLAPLANDDPDKMFSFTGHMSLGIIVGGLLVIRLLVRLSAQSPPHARTGNALLDRIGVATHWLLYGLVALMVASGLTTALVNGLFPIVFGGSGDPVPAALSESAPRLAHGLFAKVLMALLALHIAAALFHQVVLRDNLFRRMWFGRRDAG